MKLKNTSSKSEKRRYLLYLMLTTVFIIGFFTFLYIIEHGPLPQVIIRKQTDAKIKISAGTDPEGIALFESAENDNAAFSTRSVALIANETYRMVVSNTSGDSVTVVISLPSYIVVPSDSENAADSSNHISLNIDKGSNAAFSIQSYKDIDYLPSFTVSRSGKTIQYISDYDSLKTALSSSGKAAEINLLADINSDVEEDLIFYRPVAFFYGDHTLSVNGNIIFESAGEGTFQMTGNGDTVKASGFFANAPKCAVEISHPFYTFEKDCTEYYITAWHYNGSYLNATKFPVASYAMLSALADNDRYPKLSDGSSIIFTSAFSLEDSVMIEKAVSLKFNKKIDPGDYSISVFSRAEAALTYSGGSNYDYTHLFLDLPASSIIWSGKGAPGELYVSEQMNVKSYNGIALRDKYGIGGYCMGDVTYFAIRSAENTEFPSDVVFIQEGNVLVGYTESYSIDISQLTSVDIAYKTTKCKLSFPAYMKNNDGTVDISSEPICILTDTYGNTRILKIKLKRTGKGIPVVNIDIDGGVTVLDKDIYQNAVISIDSFGRFDFNSLYDTIITVRGRGNSTWKKFDKKPFRISFSQATELFGLKEGTEWIFVANYADKSLMRDRIAYEMAKLLDNMDYAPTQYCVDVFINGSYAGVYTCGAQLEVGKGRIELGEGDGADVGYVVEVGGVDDGVHIKNIDYFHAGLIKFALVRYPDKKTRTISQFNYIKSYFMKVNNAIVNLDNYEEYIDVDSFVDWLILQELSNNTDSSFRRSCYFTKQPGGKLKMGPPWDFDIAFGNFIEDDIDYDTWASYTYHNPTETNVDTSKDYVGTTWAKYLLSDPAFVKLLQKRWLEVKDALVSCALNEIDLTSADIAPSAKENFMVWNILNTRVSLERRDVTKYNTFEKQVQYLKDFIVKRSEWMTSKLEQMMKEFEEKSK
ncbi:MAG: CotH kinase family protein [Oscillospiraceae bacterium]|nr:CotH kinase family protein [Oscillospiraceae bacterium]